MRVACEWSDIKAVEFVGVAISSVKRLDGELDTRIDKDSAVMQALHYSVVIKRELLNKAKRSIFKAVVVPFSSLAMNLG